MKSLAVEHLPLIASSPDGVKKLRELILQLAVMGKLVPQDPKDEPASKVFKEAVKAEGSVGKKEKKLNTPDIGFSLKVDHPFKISSSWQWCRFADILDFQGGGQPPKSSFSDTELPGYVRLLQIRDLGEKPNPVYVKRNPSLKYCSTSDVMVGRYGASVGKVFWGQDGAYNVALVRMIDKFGSFDTQYLYYLLNSTLGQSLFSGISRSAQEGFNKNDIANRLLPLPPLAEQHRIVAKVDELMALCDKLEAQQNDSEAAHSLLVKTLLDTLTQTTDADDFAASWARIKENFHTLFTTEESVDILKQTLLQLAVMGKLDIRACQSKSWRLIKLGEVCSSSFYGPRFGKHEYAPDGVPTIRTTDMTKGGAILVTKETPRVAVPEGKLSLYQLQKGDLLVTRTGSIGVMAVFDSDCLAIPSAYLIRFRFTKEILPEYAYLFLKSPYGREQLGLSTTKVTQPNINADAIKRIELLLPPVSEQRLVLANVEQLMALCDKLQASLREGLMLQNRLGSAINDHLLVDSDQRTVVAMVSK